MSSAHRSPTRSTARATPPDWPKPRGDRAAMRGSGRRLRAGPLLRHVRLWALLHGRGGHVEVGPVVSVRVLQVAGVHEAVVLRRARLAAAGLQALGDDRVDLLARVLAQGDRRTGLGARVDDL